MTSKIFFITQSGRTWELDVLHDEDQYIPGTIAEGDDWRIQDLTGEKNWESLHEMTHDLQIEIIGSEDATEIGN